MTSTTENGWYEVTYSVPWFVHGVATPQDAINIAVSELGKQASKAGALVRNAEIDVQSMACEHCGEPLISSKVVSGEALVGLLLTIEVNAESAEESERVGQRELGPHVPGVPLWPVPSPVHEPDPDGRSAAG